MIVWEGRGCPPTRLHLDPSIAESDAEPIGGTLAPPATRTSGCWLNTPEAIIADVTIESVRSEIDAIDDAIVGLIVRRQGWVEAAGRLKRDAGLEAVRAPDRVAAVIAAVRERAVRAGGSADVVEATYRAMIDAFIELESVIQARSQRR